MLRSVATEDDSEATEDEVNCRSKPEGEANLRRMVSFLLCILSGPRTTRERHYPAHTNLVVESLSVHKSCGITSKLVLKCEKHSVSLIRPRLWQNLEALPHLTGHSATEQLQHGTSICLLTLCLKSTRKRWRPSWRRSMMRLQFCKPLLHSLRQSSQSLKLPSNCSRGSNRLMLRRRPSTTYNQTTCIRQ